jgi:predicted secreted Zn-dependent protease
MLWGISRTRLEIMFGRRIFVAVLATVALLSAGCDSAPSPSGLSTPSSSAAASAGLSSGAPSGSPSVSLTQAAQIYQGQATDYDQGIATLNADFLAAGGNLDGLRAAHLAAATLDQTRLTAMMAVTWPPAVLTLIGQLGADLRTLNVVETHLADTPGDPSLLTQWQLADAQAAVDDGALRTLFGLPAAMAQPRPSSGPIASATPTLAPTPLFPATSPTPAASTPPTPTPTPTPSGPLGSTPSTPPGLTPAPTPTPGTGTETAAVTAPGMRPPSITAAFFAPEVTLKSYPVTGDNQAAIDASIAAAGLSDNSWTGGAEAETDLLHTYHFHPAGAGSSCTIHADARPAITENITVILPQWTPPPGVSAATTQWWAGELLHDAVHERVHVRNALNAVAAANQALTSSTCDNVNAQLDAVWQKEHLADCQFDMSEYGTKAGLSLAACLAS